MTKALTFEEWKSTKGPPFHKWIEHHTEMMNRIYVKPGDPPMLLEDLMEYEWRKETDHETDNS